MKVQFYKHTIWDQNPEALLELTKLFLLYTFIAERADNC